jgi:hypothetical protein
MQSKGLLLAKALVNVKDEEKCSFYLSNVIQKGMKLGPDSVIGVLSSVDVMDDVQGDSTTPKPMNLSFTILSSSLSITSFLARGFYALGAL